jgi:hypothetical protein
MAIFYPPVFINNYLADKISEYFADNPLDGSPASDFNIPFFPTSPSSIDEITESFQANESGLFAVYDRMFRFRRRPFPHIKSEQLLYYFYATQQVPIPALIEATQSIQDLLDGEDESAQDLNDWISERINSDGLYVFRGTSFKPVYFHRIKVYQLEEARDIVDFGTARTFAGNKMIVDYDWHKS